MEFKDINFKNTAKFIQQYGPLLFQLIKGISVLNREEHSQDLYSKCIVIIASIFLLGFTQNSANSFTCLLNLYLQVLGVKYYILSFLYGLSLIDSYKTLNIKKLKLAECLKEGPINFTSPFSANNP